MRLARALLCLVSVVLLEACSCSGAQANCVELLAAPRQKQQRQIACYGYTGLDGLLGAWMPYQLDVRCAAAEYKVFTAPAPDANVTEVLWCGLRALNDSTLCRLTLSSRQPVYVSIAGASAGSCTWRATRGADPVKLGLTAGGLVLLATADRLALSQGFRLGAGSALFMSGAVLLLVALTLRSVPQKRAVVAALTISASTACAVVRWVFGTWLPSWHAVLTSRPFVWYLILSGLLGLGLTYYYDDLGNVKLNNSIRFTLKLLGLLLVYHGSADEAVAVGTVAAVGLGSLMTPHLWQLCRWLGPAVWWLVTLGAKAVPSLRRRSGAHRPAAEQPQQRGLLLLHDNKSLSLDAWQQQQLAAAAAEAAGGRATRSRVRRSSFPGFDSQLPPDDDDDDDHHHHHHHDLPPAPPQLVGTPVSATRVLHYKTPPPSAPAGLGRLVGSSSSPVVGGWGSSGGAPDASPWSEQRVVLDTRRRHPAGALLGSSGPPRAEEAAAAGPAGGTQRSGAAARPLRTTPARASASPRAAGPSRGAAAAAAYDGGGGGTQQHPLVQQGKLLNAATGRTIELGGSTYSRLLSQGYTPDLRHGTLLPPGQQPSWSDEEDAAPRPPSPARGRAAAAGAGSSASAAAGARRRHV